MADIKMPESIPCQWDQPWLGKCGKPSDNGWCSEHEDESCASCGDNATHGCGHAMSLVCGAPLCDDCVHSKNTHVTKEVERKIQEEEQRKEAEIIASRTSDTQRIHEKLKVPANLFELKKKDYSDYQLQHCYIMHLDHTVMGFFPALRVKTKEMLVITDKKLVKDAWKQLQPRRSDVLKKHAFVNEKRGVLYIDTSNIELMREEESEPISLLTREEFEAMVKSDDKPFRWARGLIGGEMNEESFLKLIETTVI